MLPEPLEEDAPPLGVRAGRHVEVEVRPVEPRLDVVARRDPERLAHVRGDLRRRGRGEGEHPPDAELGHEARDLEVVGAKVVPPLGDAVRFVDREERDLEPTETVQEALVGEAFGRDVEDLELARREAVLDLAHLVRGEAAVEPGRGDALPLQGVHLVLHESYERGDDDGDPREEERRKLIAEALAAAGREHGEDRAPGEEPLDHGLLPVPELAESEDLAELFRRPLHGSPERHPNMTLRHLLLP